MRRLIGVLGLLLPLGAPASDRQINNADVTEIRAVIHRQLDAPRRDDACAVYRPAKVSFLELVVMGGDVVQQVQITDRSGSVWVAYYAMQRQRDGGWRTNGCRLVQPSRTISA